MLSVTEIATALAASGTVVATGVAATLYFTGEGGAGLLSGAEVPLDPGRYAYEMSDAVFSCRDQVSKSIPYKVRNVNVDSHSSRYDDGQNSHVVFIDLEVVERPGSFYSKYSYGAKVMCNVSAASNEVTSFKLRRS